jgi:hypothetical protein
MCAGVAREGPIVAAVRRGGSSGGGGKAVAVLPPFLRLLPFVPLELISLRKKPSTGAVMLLKRLPLPLEFVLVIFPMVLKDRKNRKTGRTTK